ncbi:MAG TPA: corrinoid protein [bacterium]|nr:corrinoid protein [bacterium]
MTDTDHLLDRLAEAVTTMKPELVAELARKVLEQGLSPQDAMTQGLAAGMRRMGEKFAAKECFVPEVLLASKAMYAGFEILKAKVGRGESGMGGRGKVALGVVQGDIHDIGKNIVKVMVQAAGFEVVDLGRNVPLPEFVKAAENGVAVLGISSLMTTTMPRMGKVVEALDKAGLRPGVKVLVGGAPVTAQFARNIGADGFAPDAHAAVIEIERLTARG